MHLTWCLYCLCILATVLKTHFSTGRVIHTLTILNEDVFSKAEREGRNRRISLSPLHLKSTQKRNIQKQTQKRQTLKATVSPNPDHLSSCCKQEHLLASTISEIKYVCKKTYRCLSDSCNLIHKPWKPNLQCPLTATTISLAMRIPGYSGCRNIKMRHQPQWQ